MDSAVSCFEIGADFRGGFLREASDGKNGNRPDASSRFCFRPVCTVNAQTWLSSNIYTDFYKISVFISVNVVYTISDMPHI